MKSQSAMEYLTTYGWAILVMAVVLVGLFYLGVLNPLNYSSKLAPGSCSVYRPQGPGTTTGISLSGVCNGQIPQYATVQSSASCPAGGDPVQVPTILSATANAITITFWFNQAQIVAGARYVSLPSTASVNCAYGVTLSCVMPGASASGPTAISNGQWTFGAVTVDSAGHAFVYTNGQPGSMATATWNGGIGPTGITTFNMFSSIGAGPGAHCVDGMMSNVQMYNTALSLNSIQALYREGIGGVPIDLQDLSGWWPLNGDVKDYSGNMQNGVSNGLLFSGSWWSGYTAPSS